MIIFNDSNNWLEERISGVGRSYYVPDYYNGYGICIDIGANVGGFPLVHHEKFSKIICYEPALSTYNQCLENLKDLKNIEIYNYAVTNVSDEFVKLMSHKEFNYSGNASILLNNDWDSNSFELVKTISFKDVIKQANILNNKNYVKIDVEGAEYQILMNQDLSMINMLSVEIHIQLGEKKINELLEYLLRFFNVVYSRGGGKKHYEITYINKNLNILVN